MKKEAYIIVTLLSAFIQQASAWEGSETIAEPFLISNSDDWRRFARQVADGYSYTGQYFKMTADIDAQGNSVGTELFPFSGTFDGDGYTLTYNRGTANSISVQFVDDSCAPFIRLEGATIRHLNVDGNIYSSRMHAAGIAAYIDGYKPTTIFDCHVSSLLNADNSLKDDASFAGIVGNVNTGHHRDHRPRRNTHILRHQRTPTQQQTRK